MKNWIYGRRLMEEQPGTGGEGGGGGGTGGEGGGTGGAGEGQQADGNKEGDQSSAPAAKPEGGEERQTNAAAAALEAAAGDKPTEQQPGEKPKEQQPGELTDAEKEAYGKAFKLDEATFGKGVQFDPKFTERMPAFFKKYGIEPEKANQMANEFAKMQKDVEADSQKKRDEFNSWRQDELKKMNESYLTTYDKAGRETIARGILHFFPKGTPMYDAIRYTEIGVDPGFLKLMHFAGERLPKDKAPGAAAGSGSGGSGKSLADSFMGL